MTAKAVQRLRQEIIDICKTAQSHQGTQTIFQRRYPRASLQQVAKAEYLTEAQYMRKLELTYRVKVEIDASPTHCLIFGNWELALLTIDLLDRLTKNQLLPPDL